MAQPTNQSATSPIVTVPVITDQDRLVQLMNECELTRRQKKSANEAFKGELSRLNDEIKEVLERINSGMPAPPPIA